MKKFSSDNTMSLGFNPSEFHNLPEITFVSSANTEDSIIFHLSSEEEVEVNANSISIYQDTDAQPVAIKANDVIYRLPEDYGSLIIWIIENPERSEIAEELLEALNRIQRVIDDPEGYQITPSRLLDRAGDDIRQIAKRWPS